MSEATEDAGDASVGEAAYRRIRTDILFGHLSPGQKLGLDRLRETYGAGISTLRELLNRLASEGLVTAEGARGFEVALVSAEEFRELAELRLLLEGYALEQSFAAGGLDWEAGVVAAHHKLAALERSLLAGDAADPQVWKRYDWEFHRALITACRSEVLLKAHAAAYDRYLRYQMVAVVFRGAIAVEEHQALLRCALARDSASARRVLANHLNGCVEHVVSTGGLDGFSRGGQHRSTIASAPAVCSGLRRAKAERPQGSSSGVPRRSRKAAT